MPQLRKNTPLRLLPLEDRSLPTAGVLSALSGGVLTVTGTDAADTVVIRQTNSGAITVDANGLRRDFRGVNRIVANGLGGHDRIFLDTRTSDALRATPIAVQMTGGTGNDLLVGGSAADRITGSDGNDIIYGDKGADWIDGSAGADHIYGNDGDDVLSGSTSDDLLAGGAGIDYLDAGSGNDWLLGGDAVDTMIGGAGNDYCEGGAGNDRLYGGEQNDWLVGGAGDDQLSGSIGNDYLDGGAGNDPLNGGDGFDTYCSDFGDVLSVPATAANVRQGSAGTCVVLASLIAVRESGINLGARIRQTGDNEYAVPIYRPGTGWVTQTVYYDGQWTDNDPMLTGAGDAWVLIYQRAFLQEMGVRWNDPDQSTWADRYGDRFQRADSALIAITGAAVWHSALSTGMTSADLADLTASVASRRPVIVLTRGGDLSGYGLIADHAYHVRSVQRSSTGVTTVTLRNPWGVDGPINHGPNDGVITLTWDALRHAMAGFCVA